MPTFEQNMVETLRSQHIAWNAERTLAQAEAKSAAAQAELAQAMQDTSPVVPDAKSAPNTDGIVFKSAYVSDGGVIYAIAATSGTVDLDDDVLSTKALVRMAHDFTSSGTRAFKANHTDDVEAHLVASLTGAPILKSGRVLSFGESFPEDDPMVGLSLEGEPSCWLVGIRPVDKAVAELAKAGGIAGLSWGAWAVRAPIEE